MNKEVQEQLVKALSEANIEWIAKDAFRVWYTKQNWDEESGGVTMDVISKDFKVTEI